jgi:hypothetical protein
MSLFAALTEAQTTFHPQSSTPINDIVIAFTLFHSPHAKTSGARSQYRSIPIP